MRIEKSEVIVFNRHIDSKIFIQIIKSLCIPFETLIIWKKIIYPHDESHSNTRAKHRKYPDLSLKKLLIIKFHIGNRIYDRNCINFTTNHTIHLIHEIK